MQIVLSTYVRTMQIIQTFKYFSMPQQAENFGNAHKTIAEDEEVMSGE